MSAKRFTDWIVAYGRAWRTAGTAAVRDLFTTEASYRPAPFDEPLHGWEAIAVFWEAEREGPDEIFTLAAEVVAADGATGVARLEVRYGDPVTQTYRDLWIIELDDTGRCTAFEEWPFHPAQARVVPR
jgi:hypothetical protein